ncbi:hypothetical protein [Bacillus tuaregi]|uniref:hypothetical protein n=1 Tax=Bacillus tuaregi TaxID=1816695 RepID=UPI0008F928EE|nr:hypothetical protein [Bacillus tuaregi]
MIKNKPNQVSESTGARMLMNHKISSVEKADRVREEIIKELQDEGKSADEIHALLKAFGV